MRTKKRKLRLDSVSIVLLCVVTIITMVGFVVLESKEAKLNILVESTEQEIADLKTEIDGLDMQKQKLVSFNRVEQLAVEKGYTYKHNTTTALAIGVNGD